MTSNIASPQKSDALATSMLMMTGKTSLMNRVQNSPGQSTFKGKSMLRSTIGATGSTMGTTLDATGANNAITLDYSKSSPFKDTISKGMITGVGLLNKQSLSKIKKNPVSN
jgi:hypothetical protein